MFQLYDPLFSISIECSSVGSSVSLKEASLLGKMHIFLYCILDYLASKWVQNSFRRVIELYVEKAAFKQSWYFEGISLKSYEMHL